MRIQTNDADLFPLAGVTNNTAKEEVIMTVRKAKKQLAKCIRFLHLDAEEYTIRNRHLVSKNGKMDFPVWKLVAIIPAHGTVMALFPNNNPGRYL